MENDFYDTFGDDLLGATGGITFGGAALIPDLDTNGTRAMGIMGAGFTVALTVPVISSELRDGDISGAFVESAGLGGALGGAWAGAKLGSLSVPLLGL